MKAQIIKETEKAIQVNFVCEIYGDDFTIKNVWFPKSQIKIISTENKILEFKPKNDWILNAKVKDYCKYVAETFSPNIKTEIKTYLSPINSVVVDFCWI